jgi:hypothetical protein
MLGPHQAEICHEMAGIDGAVMSSSSATNPTPRRACNA